MKFQFSNSRQQMRDCTENRALDELDTLQGREENSASLMWSDGAQVVALAVKFSLLILLVGPSYSSASSLTAACGSSILFDSYSSRSEGDILSAADSSTFFIAPGEVYLSINGVVPSTQPKPSMCMIDWMGPLPPFTVAYTPTSMAPDSDAVQGWGAYSQFASTSRVSLVVVHSSSCGVALGPSSTYLSAANAAPNTTAWQQAAISGTGYSSGSISSNEWVQVLPPTSNSGAAATAVYQLTVTAPFAIATPFGCDVSLLLVSSVRAALPWFAWIPPTLVSVLAFTVQIVTALRSPAISGGLLMAFTVACYAAFCASAFGLLLACAVDQLERRILPLSAGTSFFVGLLCLTAIVTMVCLSRICERRAAISLTLRLAEQTLAMAFSAAIWYRGFVILGIFSLLTIVLSNVYYNYLLSALVDALPDADLEVRPPVYMTWAFFAPFTAPIGPLLGLYGPLFITRHLATQSSVSVIRNFDAVVSLRAVVATSLPQLVVACIAVVLHPPFVTALITLVALIFWSATLGLRRYFKLRQMADSAFSMPQIFFEPQLRMKRSDASPEVLSATNTVASSAKRHAHVAVVENDSSVPRIEADALPSQVELNDRRKWRYILKELPAVPEDGDVDDLPRERSATPSLAELSMNDGEILEAAHMAIARRQRALAHRFRVAEQTP